MNRTALEDVVVVEVATSVSAGYAGRLLSDLGAQVILVEPVGGSTLRAEPPLAANGESVFWSWLHGGKLGVTLDSRDSLEVLLRNADIVLFDDDPSITLDADILVHGGSTVGVGLSPYGSSGPRSDWQATPLTEYATSGFHYFGGDPAREPIALPGHQVAFHAGMHAAFGALAGLHYARDTGLGQIVEVSHQEAVLANHAWLTTMWTHQGKVQMRAGSAFVPCADGFIYMFNLAPYPNLFVLMERFDLLADETLLSPMNWFARFGEVQQALAEWAATRTKQEIYHAAQELRIAITPVNNMADIAVDPQLVAREWFTQVPAGGQSFQAPGFPYRLTGTPCLGRRPAPELGQHNAEVFDPAFGWANQGVEYGGEDAEEDAFDDEELEWDFDEDIAPDEGRIEGALASMLESSLEDLLEEMENQPGPLAGLRVIELTANWAGPICGRQFADLGADVIKVELQTKPATRALVPVADDLWPEHYHRSGYFNKLNRNKRDVCLDLSKPEGRAVFLKLVETADALIENNAARVMGQLGLDFETLQGVNPLLVMCSMSGFGATGPERNYSAYGSNIETMSGLASLLGYGPGEYFGTGSYYADPVTGVHAAVATLAALHHRRTSGRGQWIDASLLEAGIQFFSQQFFEYSVTGRIPEPAGNHTGHHCPEGVYPAFGKDCWLAVSVRHQRDWADLCEAIGRGDLATDSTLLTREGREARREEIDEAIRAWSLKRDHIAGADALQAAGVPAAPVMPNWEIVTDNHLNDREYFVKVRHPRAGTIAFPGFPWDFGLTPASIRMHAPLFAEHNREIFEELCMPDDEIDALYAAGATADAPVYASGPSL